MHRWSAGAWRELHFPPLFLPSSDCLRCSRRSSPAQPPAAPEQAHAAHSFASEPRANERSSCGGGSSFIPPVPRRSFPARLFLQQLVDIDALIGPLLLRLAFGLADPASNDLLIFDAIFLGGRGIGTIHLGGLPAGAADAGCGDDKACSEN